MSRTAKGRDCKQKTEALSLYLLGRGVANNVQSLESLVIPRPRGPNPNLTSQGNINPPSITPILKRVALSSGVGLQKSNFREVFRLSPVDINSNRIRRGSVLSSPARCGSIKYSRDLRISIVQPADSCEDLQRVFHSLGA